MKEKVYVVAELKGCGKCVDKLLRQQKSAGRVRFLLVLLVGAMYVHLNHRLLAHSAHISYLERRIADLEES